MAIQGLDEEQFKQILKQNLTPARAISSPEHLKGRARALTQIDRAFNSPGKHIFIYGDRGVGKTSLAQTAAFLHQSPDADPVLVACGAGPFLNTVRDAVRLSLPAKEEVFQRAMEHKIKAGVAGIGYEMTRTLRSGIVPPLASENDAIQLLRIVSELHSREPVIIFDEFDQIPDSRERKICAQVIKQVSEQLNVRLILCGIGTSMEDLIGVHLSAGRYLSPVELERLTHDARWEIVQAAAEALRVTVPYSYLVRIGQISDGFPSYIHLIAEQIFWSMFDDATTVRQCEQKHFAAGVMNAVKEAETTLKIIYDNATQKYSDDYEEVLWALADSQLLRRQTTEIYERSYLRIMAERPDRKKLDKSQFSGRLNSLKTDRHGSIIVGKGAGWYEFRENIVRGYVRLRAEHQGMRLGIEGFA